MNAANYDFSVLDKLKLMVTGPVVEYKDITDDNRVVSVCIEDGVSLCFVNYVALDNKCAYALQHYFEMEVEGALVTINTKDLEENQIGERFVDLRGLEFNFQSYAEMESEQQVE